MTGSTAIEFGLFDWVDASGRDTATHYDERIALVRRADARGFGRYHVAEHHGTPLGLASSPAVWLAAVARETSRIRLVPTTFIVPLYDPLRLVQEIGMLDQLSHGRLEIGIGKGSSPIEAGFFGFDREEMAERYAAHTPAILAALETGVFTDPRTGERTELFVRPRAVPEVWYPTGNPDSVTQAASRGQNAIFGFAFRSPPLEVIREHRELYFAERARAAAERSDAATPRFGIMRHVVVADTDDEAFALARAAFDEHFDSFSHLWRRAQAGQYEQTPDVHDLVDRHLFFVGSAETVREQVAHVIARTGINYLAGAFAWGGLPHEAALRSLELFDEHVIPAVTTGSAGAR
ncbi:LLM class flavin-dependent oxidoreductase [Microbacterium rhizophilus]|uniref:LLM class flavin-dependent oxidoreductase n=1 Tax=Microbacterium rhizophilus TaxID=3138934 RepID=UPI0031ED7815